ncbi:MAG: alanyl-tRNA editing protein AlaX-L [Clostridiaceae bacterium]|nr:alanyl-tRNA editing protein AlaX-L [Clostridiaceae bacterium]
MRKGCAILEKSYYENIYQKEFTAEIINVTEKDNKYHVELDKSYFYPNTDGQVCDTGWINNFPVMFIYEENSRIYHVLEVKPIKIHRVSCVIDFDKKFTIMQQNLGKHVLSICFQELFNANTISSPSGSSFIEIDKNLLQEDLLKVEEMSNKLISDNIKIQVLYPNNAELKKMNIKKSNANKNEEIRVVQILDFQACPCKALHPISTIEIQMIKLTKLEKRGNISRIEFICGRAAVSDYLDKYMAIEKMSKLFGCKDIEVLQKVEALSGELKKALAEKSSLKSEIADYEVLDMLTSAETIKDVRIIKSIYNDVDIKHTNVLATKLVSFPKVIILFGAKTADKTYLLFMCSKDLNLISMNLLLKDAITLIDGKGGGSDFSAQGAGKSANNLSSSLEYAYNKVKGLLL